MDKKYYIKELEKILGKSRTTIFYWEATNKIPKARRTPMGNYRYWDTKNIEHIKNKLKGKL